MITVSSCGVKLQEVLSGLGLEKKAKRLDIHMHFCGFSQHSFTTSYFFLSTWGVIFSTKVFALITRETHTIANFACMPKD